MSVRDQSMMSKSIQANFSDSILAQGCKRDDHCALRHDCREGAD